MSNFEHEKYNPCRQWIRDKIESGISWEEIRSLCVSPDKVETTLEDFCDYDWPSEITIEGWYAFTDYQRKKWKTVSLVEDNPVSGLERFPGDPSIVPLTGDASTWVQYKRRISNTLSDESIAEIEKSCKWILSHLRLDTRNQNDSVKGLVMGSVQSGKTANMCGLVSMAADLDWNIIIVLSGTIDNLRIQTRDRFKKDLQSSEGIAWNILDFAGEDKKYSASDLRLNGLDNKTYNRRYLTVCLKQRGRLEKLIDWLYSDENMTHKMRIIVIDDEADQASINTAKILSESEQQEEQERKAINQLIVNLVNGLKSDGSSPRISFQAINYISYTATPYANVLNEVPGVSLYPSDFICSLEEAKEYFGAKIIFGNDEADCSGMDIIRDVPASELAVLKDIHKGQYRPLPDEFKKAVAWFLCAVAVLRKNGYGKPISMLIHTAAKQDNHFDIHEHLQSWLKETAAVLSLCQEVYVCERDAFLKADLEAAYPEYGLLNDVFDTSYSFDEIDPYVQELISEVTPLLMDEEKDIQYHKGVHLCVDNCRANRYAEEGTALRIVYPAEEQLSHLEAAPAFIVIGGNTLSRGLTIEGLVCSYFTRNSTQADTLMQMARWFGYRKGLELLQRIWMSSDVVNKFRVLTKVDMDLKKELRVFMEMGISPEKYGPRIRALPAVAKLRITAKNKSQSAIDDSDSFDFSGLSYETTKFDADESLKRNMDATEKMLFAIIDVKKPQQQKNAAIWRNISSEIVRKFLREEYLFSQHSGLSVDIPIFLDWLARANSEGKFSKWNIAVAGDTKSSYRWELPGDVSIGCIERSRKKEVCYVDIGSLRSGRDVLCDVSESELNDTQKKVFETAMKRGERLISARAQLNLNDTPLLLIYCIKKDGGAASKLRLPLDLNTDIIGLSIIVPGDTKGNGYTQFIKVNILPE